jgi:uncharacterized protein
MPDQADLEVVRNLYKAVPVGSAQVLAELLDPEVQWHVPGRHARSGTYDGRDAALRLLSHPARSSFEVLDVSSGRHLVMALIRHRSEQGGQQIDARFVHVLRMNAGRIIESWHFDEDQAQLDRFMSAAGSAET